MRLIILILFLNFSFAQSNEYEVVLNKIENQFIAKKDSLPSYISKLKILNSYSSPEEKKTVILYAECFNSLANTNYPEALSQVNELEKLISNTKHKRLEGKIYYLHYLILERVTNYVEAIKYLKKTEKTSLEINDIALLQNCYRSHTMIYLDQKNFDLALKYALKSNEFSKKMNDENLYSSSLSLLGEVYRERGEYKKSEDYFAEAYKLQKRINSKINLAWTLTNWSLLYDDDLIKSLKMELEAQAIWDEYDAENTMSIVNLGNIAWCYKTIAENDSLLHILKPKKNKSETFKIAKSYYNKAITLARQKKNFNSYSFNLIERSYLQYQSGNYKNAFDDLELGYNLKDSIFSQKQKNKIAKLESQKIIDLKNKELEIKNINIENQKKQKWYLISIVSLSVLILIILYFNNKKLKSLNQQLEISNQIKLRFFSILNHDLRSPIANLIHFLTIQKNTPELFDEASKKRLEAKSIKSAENLLNSMEDILLWSKSQMEHFAPRYKKISVNSIFNDTKEHFSSEDKIKIEFEFENSKGIELFTDENYLKTIIRNLTGNAIKALNKIERPSIVWKVWQDENKIFLSITDNGNGADSKQLKGLYDDKEVIGIKSGLGLHLIRDLAKAINCEISVDSKKDIGTTFTLTFN
ncbi:MAG: tetratricopeptide repeat-containing sensor histidine kinase [Flavobacterium sp.]|uniref:ATP-binding protein n=1 Tax=Flavobacterium sp. TaxID=239 RepID=UPI00352787AF